MNKTDTEKKFYKELSYYRLHYKDKHTADGPANPIVQLLVNKVIELEHKLSQIQLVLDRTDLNGKILMDGIAMQPIDKNPANFMLQ